VALPGAAADGLRPVGTSVGFVEKYMLDKRWIFFDD